MAGCPSWCQPSSFIRACDRLLNGLDCPSPRQSYLTSTGISDTCGRDKEITSSYLIVKFISSCCVCIFSMCLWNDNIYNHNTENFHGTKSSDNPSSVDNRNKIVRPSRMRLKIPNADVFLIPFHFCFYFSLNNFFYSAEILILICFGDFYQTSPSFFYGDLMYAWQMQGDDCKISGPLSTTWQSSLVTVDYTCHIASNDQVGQPARLTVAIQTSLM